MTGPVRTPAHGCAALGPVRTPGELEQLIVNFLNGEGLHTSTVRVSHSHAILATGYAGTDSVSCGQLLAATHYFTAIVTWFRPGLPPAPKP